MTARYRPSDNGTNGAKDPTNNARQQRFRDRRKAKKAQAAAAIATASPSSVVGDNAAPTVINPVIIRRRDGGVTVAAFGAAVALASVSGFFGVAGMTAIFAAAPVPVMVMTAVLEAAKLVTAAWLARHWRVAPLAFRVPLIGVVLVLMLLSGIGTYGYFTRAHLAH